MSGHAVAAKCTACNWDAVVVYDGDVVVEAYHPADVCRDMTAQDVRCPALIPMDCPCLHYSHRIPADQTVVEA